MILLAFGLLLVITGIGIAGKIPITKFYKNISGQTDKERKAKFHNDIRASLKPITFMAEGQSMNDARQAVKSLDDYMKLRSGYSLPGKSREKLAELAYLTAQSRMRRLATTDIAQSLITALKARLQTISDKEVDKIARIMSGMGDNEDPVDPEKRQVRLRASIAGGPTMAQFMRWVNKAKQGDTEGNGLVSMASYLVDNEVQKHFTPLAEALPAPFNLASGCDPIAATLLVYSTVADDLLALEGDSGKASIRKALKAYRIPETEDNLNKWTVFGDKGIVYPSPLKVVLDDKTLDVFLSELERRGR
jgi:hypothetical protein